MAVSATEAEEDRALRWVVLRGGSMRLERRRGWTGGLGQTELSAER